LKEDELRAEMYVVAEDLRIEGVRRTHYDQNVYLKLCFKHDEDPDGRPSLVLPSDKILRGKILPAIFPVFLRYIEEEFLPFAMPLLDSDYVATFINRDGCVVIQLKWGFVEVRIDSDTWFDQCSDFDENSDYPDEQWWAVEIDIMIISYSRTDGAKEFIESAEFLPKGGRDEWEVYNKDDEQNALAFLHALHPRLGAASYFGNVEIGIVRWIAELVLHGRKETTQEIRNILMRSYIATTQGPGF
jgi:hypothetical protein